VIRIDVHPVGENPTNMTHMLSTLVHVRLAYASYGQPPDVATFHEPSTELSRATTPEKRGSRHNLQHTGRPIRGSVPSFSPELTKEVVGQSQASIDDRLLGLLSPYHQHAIVMINTCSREPTHQSLTDTGGGTTLEVPAFHIPLLGLPNQLSPLST
jgi:hypothetical protein